MRSMANAFGQRKKHDRTKETSVKRHTQEGAEVFGQFVCEHKKAVFAVAYAKLRNMHDAEDIMQDVFIEAYRNFHKLRKPGKIRAWLCKATIYRCTDHIRKMSRRRKREMVFAASVPDNPSTGALVENEHCEAVVEAIGKLPEKYRVVVILKHFSQLSYSEISEMTGLSTTMIGNRLQVARKKLRENLNETVEGVD